MVPGWDGGWFNPPHQKSPEFLEFIRKLKTHKNTCIPVDKSGVHDFQMGHFVGQLFSVLFGSLKKNGIKAVGKVKC